MRARSGYYWIPDIIDIQVKIKELEAQPERLAKFRSERKTLVEDMNHHMRRCVEWTHSDAQRNAQRKVRELEYRRGKRYSRIKTRLLDLGYTEEDVEGIRKQPSVIRDAELTSDSWNRIRPSLEVVIKEKRVRKAKAARSAVLYKRATIVEGIFKTYIQQYLPVVWRELPSYMDVCTFPGFRDILESPTENIVTEASFADARNKLPRLVADWQKQRESTLRALVSPRESGRIDPLKLATTVFSCERGCRAVITKADIWRHQCVARKSTSSDAANVDEVYSKSGNAKLFFDTTRSAVAASLVRLASCDPATTTAEEMDSLHLQFIHMDDHTGRFGSADNGTGLMCKGRPVLSWRECVQANIGQGSDFRLLTPDDEARKLQIFKEIPVSWTSAFFHCQHCAEHHLWNAKSYEEVSQHVRDIHGVDDPQVDHDLFLTPGADIPAGHGPPLYIVKFKPPSLC
ncbi:hypothetical protein ARMGADRAFT_222082 [Armillaria gallica]|uniref:Uncharacterized protein n=1 Tax=Armillaria gallica TaxID=47427 RepID=A0A2H3EP52_ARMGA|nr:hypothetical protein ARMGADRAFT_222082 [Armillaria gallica]